MKITTRNHPANLSLAGWQGADEPPAAHHLWTKPRHVAHSYVFTARGTARLPEYSQLASGSMPTSTCCRCCRLSSDYRYCRVYLYFYARPCTHQPKERIRL